jgi:hypothetical protein
VRVRAPADLATRVRRQLKEAAAQYGDDDRADDATNDDEPASAPAAGG